MKSFTLLLQVLMLTTLIACGESNKTPEQNEDSQAQQQNEQSKQGRSSDNQLSEAAQATKNELAEKNQRLKDALKNSGKNVGIGGSCAETSIKVCGKSPNCMVEQKPDGKYLCRDAANSCETGFVQEGGKAMAKVCNDKPGCTFDPGKCYCPPGVTCVCGGGAPASCVASSES